MTTGAANATVTWAGPVTGAGGTDPGGRFAVGGLPDGRYTITASLPGCQPGIATATVTAGVATPHQRPHHLPAMIGAAARIWASYARSLRLISSSWSKS